MFVCLNVKHTCFLYRNLAVEQLMVSPLRTIMFKVEDIVLNNGGQLSATASFIDPEGKENNCEISITRTKVIHIECFVGVSK